MTLGFLTYTLVWSWVGPVFARSGSSDQAPPLSFLEALVDLRTVLWTEEFFPKGPAEAIGEKIVTQLRDILAHAS